MIPVSGFQGQEVAVFGLGRTGLTAAQALVAGGAKVAVWDDQAHSRQAARDAGFDLVDLSTADWSRFSALMLSPGVPLHFPVPHWTVEKAHQAGVEVLGDIELFARTVNAVQSHRRPRIVAITGTNGKSTTTALIAHLLRHAGRDTRIGGNIGFGVLGLEDMHGGAVYVLEISSYQLDLTASLKPDVAVLLNVSPDHLDRHGGMDGYVAAKRRVFFNQTREDTAIIGVDDPWCQKICTEITASNHRVILPVSASRALGRGLYALSGVLYDATGPRVVDVADLTAARSLPGRHNWQNAAAAYAAALALSIAPAVATEGLLTFPGLAHRMETVAQFGPVQFVNDSKATNADAARQALSSYPKVYWIAGGRAKAGGIEPLADLFPRIAKAYLIGEAADDFAATLDGQVDWQNCVDLQSAVRHAAADAAKSAEPAIVLLSPACASFDQFADFEARGDAFRHAVLQLAANMASGSA